MHLMHETARALNATDGRLQAAIIFLDVLFRILDVAAGRIAEVEGIERRGADAALSRAEGMWDADAMKQRGDVIDDPILVLLLEHLSGQIKGNGAPGKSRRLKGVLRHAVFCLGLLDLI